MSAINNRAKALINSQGLYIPDSFENEAFQGEYDGNDNLIYAGYALIGTSTAVAKWQLFKMTYDGNDNLLNITWPINDQGAVSSDYEFVWDDRGTYTYQ